EPIRNRLETMSQPFKGFFSPETNTTRRKLQFFWAILVVLLTIAIAGLVFLVFFKNPIPQVTHKEQQPTLIESGYTKTSAAGAWRYTIDTSLTALRETVNSLQSKLNESSQEKAQAEETRNQDLETRLLEMENSLLERLKATGSTQGNVSSLDPLPGIV